MKQLIIISLLMGLMGNMYAWSVKPMSKSLEAKERSYQLKINNKDGKTPIAIRLSAYDRDVDNLGEDKLVATKDIVVFPKQLIVRPGKVAVARVSIRKANGSPVEKAYRVVVDQVPVRRAEEKTGVKVLTRYLTSIYLKPQAKAVEDFSFTGGSVDKNSISLRAKNKGNIHKVVLPSSIIVTKNSGETVTMDKKFEPVNILPGKEVDIVLPVNTEVLQNATAISFKNTCVTCGKETYEVKLSSKN